MHWFWRAAIAVRVGAGVEFAAVDLGFRIVAANPATNLAYWILAICGGPSMAVLTYGLLTRRYYHLNRSGGETRCRKCSYVLKGITEPRCPECGEPV